MFIKDITLSGISNYLVIETGANDIWNQRPQNTFKWCSYLIFKSDRMKKDLSGNPVLDDDSIFLK